MCTHAGVRGGERWGHVSEPSYNPSTFGGFYALAVDDTGCRLHIPLRSQTRNLDQLEISDNRGFG